MPQMTLQQVDSLCDEFEAALQKGDTILIEDLLPKVDESQRPALLKELLEVEIQFVAEQSASDSTIRNMQASFTRRFPNQLDLIQSLFRQTSPLQRIGDYEILGELGRGGMGVVYQAKHKLLHQTVAIKVLSQNLLDDPQAVGRFKREMQLIGGLAHPNIVRALNAGEIEGMHYLAMEYVDGMSLHKLVESVRKQRDALPIIPLGAACEAIRQVALGLQNAHELKLVHRDIKPANLMVDYRGTVKILDLGLGKFAEEQRDDYHSSLTMEGMVIGTVDYISPEQCENSREADIRSDLYSLGCTLYFLLTGKPVYSGSRYDTMRKKLMAHIVGDPPSLRSVIPNVPPVIESIFQKAVAKDPAERFQTPIEFAEALAPFASFDEFWTLVEKAIPSDSTEPRSNARPSSPYGSFYSSNPNAPPPPVSRLKRIGFFILLNLLIFGLGIGAAFYFYTSYQQEQIYALRKEASQAGQNALQLWKQWKMGEAQAEYQKAARLAEEDFSKTKEYYLRAGVTEYWFQAAKAQWYHGDSARARQELQSLLNRIDDHIRQEEEPIYSFLAQQKFILESLGDFVLFGGAASGRNRERFANGISRYEEAIKVPTQNSHDTIIRWKQAILLMLNGELDRAETLIQGNLKGKNPNILCQLAEAVLFYYQQGDHANRDQKLRAFRQQFGLPSNELQAMAMQPGTVELLLFSGELLIEDSIKRENWQVLADDFTAINNATSVFLRQYPGATPFMRRFNELLVHTAVLLHTNTEQPKYMASIARLLERRRNIPAGEVSTMVYFFLPESNIPEEGFVLFYPQDGRVGTLYPLLLTRQMVRQGANVPPLDEQLLKQIRNESKTRISWDDTASWAHGTDTLTEANYPYKDVLPLGFH